MSEPAWNLNRRVHGRPERLGAEARRRHFWRTFCVKCLLATCLEALERRYFPKVLCAISLSSRRGFFQQSFLP